MPAILDQVRKARESFCPKTAREYLALQIATKLSDTKNVLHYAVTLEHYSEQVVLRAFGRCTRDKMNAESFWKCFREITGQDDGTAISNI